MALGEPGGAKRDVLLEQVQVVLHTGAGGTVFGVILCIGGEADHLVHPVHGVLHLAYTLIPVQTSSKSLSNSGDTESRFWGKAGSGSF